MIKSIGRSKILLFLVVFLLHTFCTSAQDTVFVKKYTFEESVNNIDGDGKNLIVRTANHLYLLGNDGFKEIRNIDLSVGRYTWIRSHGEEPGFATFNTNYVTNQKHITKAVLGELLPGGYHPNITKANRGKSLFICYKGSVLEYKINGFYNIEHKGKSVRCVYNDDTIKITATYSGVYVDTAYWAFAEIPTPGGDYSNGEVTKVNDKYYMCKDYIMVYEKGRWKRINKVMTNPDFLKLREHNGLTYFLSEQSIGTIDLETGEVTNVLFDKHGVLRDLMWMGNEWGVAAEDGYLYLLRTSGKVQKIFVGSSVYDINIKGNIAILSCRDGLYKYDVRAKVIQKLYDLTEVVQSMYVENDLLISTFSGLYVMHNEKLYTLVPYVEFNRFALSQWEDRVFAGSIEGLYVLDRDQLIHDIIPSLTPYEVATSTSSIYIYVLLISLTVLFGILYFTIRKRQKTLQVEVIKRTKITPESIRQIMLEDEKIISVEAVAEHFATSTVQLNRILKRYNTSGLTLLKEIKGEIVMSMIDKQIPLDQIATRVGYSIPYIKRNYIKKLL